MSNTACTKDESRRLADRVFDVIPLDHMVSMRLLSLVDIEASRQVPTAGVTVGERSRLLLNPDFVAEHCADDNALMMLVLHELHHLMMGHTRLPETPSLARNVAFDALINAQLCRALPSPEHTALFRKIYRPDRLPDALLRPPEGWGTDGRCDWQLKGASGRVHQALYSEHSATEKEILDLFARRNRRPHAGDRRDPDRCPDLQDFDRDRLLGDHAPRPEPAPTAPSTQLQDAASYVVGHWVTALAGKKRSDAGIYAQARVDPREARRETVAVVRRALHHVCRPAAAALDLSQVARRSIEGVLPFRTGLDRRAAVLEAAGCPTMLYRTDLDRITLAGRDRTHLYIDVSGSMCGELPLLYGALIPLLDRLHEKIHLFSTRIYDIRPAQLRFGEVHSEWGTSISCVTGHLLDNDIERACIITDGYVGWVPRDHRERLRRRRPKLSVVLTDPSASSFAKEVGARVFAAPRLA